MKANECLKTPKSPREDSTSSAGGQVDPDGDRTIGVLTKPDLIGPGNEDEAAAVLKNIRKPLKLGYVMVKCRSQRDIDQGDVTRGEMSLSRGFNDSVSHAIRCASSPQNHGFMGRLRCIHLFQVGVVATCLVPGRNCRLPIPRPVVCDDGCRT